MSEEGAGRGGMRVMFWSWVGIIAVGLIIMIALPLTGR